MTTPGRGRRVLLVSHFFPPDAVGGVERITQFLARDLVREGHVVSVVARRGSPAPRTPRLVRGWLPDGTQLYRFVGGLAPDNQFLKYARALEDLFEEVVFETQPQVVHFMHLLHQSPRFVEIAHRYGAAVVASLQDYFFVCPTFTLRQTDGSLCDGPRAGLECARACFDDEGDRALLRWGLRATYMHQVLALADRVICPSEHVATYFERIGVPRERMRVIPNPALVEPTTPPPMPTPRERGYLHLAFVGSVVPHKGPRVILDALEVAQAGFVRLSLFGPEDPGDAAYARGLYERAASIAHLSIRAHGAYHPDDLGVLLRDVDCVVTPSQWHESYGMVAREALALGVPVIVARVGGLAEAVIEGVNGFTFAHDRPGELALLIERLARDDGLLLRLREGARMSAMVRPREHAAAVRRVYDEAVAARRARVEGACVGDNDELRFLYTALEQVGFAELPKGERKAADARD